MSKLTYLPVSADLPGASAVKPGDGDPIASPLNGSWTGSDGSMLQLNVSSAYDTSFGWVLGTYSLGGVSQGVAGVTDIFAGSAGLALESVALTLLDGQGNTIALAGTLDLDSKALTLLSLVSIPTMPTVSYAQTTAATVTYVTT